MKALIWGANGQDGKYLASLLEHEGLETVGISRSGGFLFTDLTDYNAVKNLIKDLRPDYIFHLAANSTTRHDAWSENHHTISTGTIHILEAVKEVSPESKVFISGSGLQFVNRGLPITENDPFDASSIYSVSRIHSVFAARYYRKFGLKIYVGYFFNHDSPIRSEKHVTKKITEAILRISAGSKEKLEIGNMHVKKEWGFAGDIVKGAWTLVQQHEIFETVIGTGEAYSILDWLKVCFAEYGMQWQDHVIELPGFIPEYSILVSDPTRLKSLGWKPQVDFEGLAKMMLR